MIEKYSYEQIEEIQEALKICADIVYLSDNVSSHLKDSNYTPYFRKIQSLMICFLSLVP